MTMLLSGVQLLLSIRNPASAGEPECKELRWVASTYTQTCYGQDGKIVWSEVPPVYGIRYGKRNAVATIKERSLGAARTQRVLRLSDSDAL